MIVPVIVIPYQGNLLFGSSLYEGAHTDKHDNRLLHCVPYFLRNLAARITFFRCLSSCPTRKLSQIIICWQVQRFLFIFLKIISGKLCDQKLTIQQRIFLKKFLLINQLVVFKEQKFLKYFVSRQLLSFHLSFVAT